MKHTQEKVLMSVVSWRPVRHLSLPSPQVEICALCLNFSFSIAFLITSKPPSLRMDLVLFKERGALEVSSNGNTCKRKSIPTLIRLLVYVVHSGIITAKIVLLKCFPLFESPMLLTYLPFRRFFSCAFLHRFVDCKTMFTCNLCGIQHHSSPPETNNRQSRYSLYE